jgi:hypothetical protein
MIHDLPGRPAPGPVRRIELAIVEPFHGGAELPGKGIDLADQPPPRLRVNRRRRRPFADGIPEVRVVGHVS